MSTKRRELIVLSDGTGNSASKPFKTNVWRLYQALNLRDGSQVAVFGDGVGNSSIAFLRAIGLALGLGVKRNVLNLYKFICHNYRPANNDEGRPEADRIWMFGFSRGAFTIRVLAGLIDSQGLVTFTTEAELKQNAIAAYRAYRAHAFRGKSRWFKNGLPWVRWARGCRDALIRLWRRMTGGRQYEDFLRQPARIHFIGVWDTVAAYGLPIDELTIAANNLIWPMQFDKRELLISVDNARQAMGLDDERRTFHPIPWSEDDEKRIQAERPEREKQIQADPTQKLRLSAPDNRLLQVWFPGMHSDVGGGYPDDGLSLVPLCWMIDEAADKGLKFEEDIVKIYRAQASPTGRLNDSRAGYGVLWRYQPRNAQLLMDDRCYNVPEDKRITPIMHYGAITRMTYGNDGYAPISLPLDIKILLPNVIGRLPLAPDATVHLNKDAVDAALKQPKDDETKTVLEDMAALLKRKEADKYDRSDYFELVADTVWWRRFVYFLTLTLVLIALVYPVIYQALGWGDISGTGSQAASGAVTYFGGLFKGLLPAFAAPWIDAASRSALVAIVVVVAFLVSLALSSFLQFRIHDRARAAWNIQPETGGSGRINRMRLTGQRRGLATMTFLLAAATLASFFVAGDVRSMIASVVLFGAATAASAIAWSYRVVKRREDDVDPTHPRWLLQKARDFRKNPRLVEAYRAVAQTWAPAGLFIIVAWLGIGAINLSLFNVQSSLAWNALGEFCPPKKHDEATEDLIKKGRYEKLGTVDDLSLKKLCAPTGLWVIAGREYRIQVEQSEPWFDRTWSADVTGFTAGYRHLFFTPLKRWWIKDWFQPVVRVGDVGNYEYPLFSTSPLPKVDFKDSRKHCKLKSPPLTKEDAERQVQCEKANGAVRNKVLIADITPNATGQLYFYVNDAVLWIPFLQDTFYGNNIGRAKITVTRTVAPATIDFKPD